MQYPMHVVPRDRPLDYTKMSLWGEYSYLLHLSYASGAYLGSGVEFNQGEAVRMNYLSSSDDKVDLRGVVEGKKYDTAMNLVNLVFAWSLNDVFDRNLSQVNKIPKTFASLEHYLSSYTKPLLEEVRSDLCSSLEAISHAPSQGWMTYFFYLKPDVGMCLI